MVVTLSTEHITDWETFHAECARVFGFPQFYGRNMNAWIDCLSYLHDNDGMCRVVLAPDDHILSVRVRNFKQFSARLPDICDALLTYTASVNWRYSESGEYTRIALILE
jgi:hypothetical protein